MHFNLRLNQFQALQFRNLCDSATATADNTSADENTGEEQDPELPLHIKGIKNPTVDRRIRVDVDTSIRYVASSGKLNLPFTPMCRMT